MTKPATHNGFDPTKATNFVKAIETELGKKETSKAKHLKRCREISDDIASIYDNAKQNGIPVKILRNAIRDRQLQKARRMLRDGQEADQQQLFDLFQFAIGDIEQLPEPSAPEGLPGPNGQTDLEDVIQEGAQ